MLRADITRCRQCQSGSIEFDLASTIGAEQPGLRGPEDRRESNVLRVTPDGDAHQLARSDMRVASNSSSAADKGLEHGMKVRRRRAEEIADGESRRDVERPAEGDTQVREVADTTPARRRETRSQAVVVVSLEPVR